MKRGKKIKLTGQTVGGYVDEFEAGMIRLPFECWCNIIHFLRDYKVYSGLILSVKGLSSYINNLKPDYLENIQFKVFYSEEFCPPKFKYPPRPKILTVIVLGGKIFNNFPSLEECSVFRFLKRLNVRIKDGCYSEKSKKVKKIEKIIIQSMKYLEEAEFKLDRSFEVTLLSIERLRTVIIHGAKSFYYHNCPNLSYIVSTKTNVYEVRNVTKNEIGEMCLSVVEENLIGKIIEGSIDGLRNVVKLRVFFRSEPLNRIRGLPNLREFFFVGRINFLELSQHNNLESLRIERKPQRRSGCLEKIHLPNLKKLIIRNFENDRTDLLSIRGVVSLEYLDVVNSMEISLGGFSPSKLWKIKIERTKFSWSPDEKLQNEEKSGLETFVLVEERNSFFRGDARTMSSFFKTHENLKKIRLEILDSNVWFPVPNNITEKLESLILIGKFDLSTMGELKMIQKLTVMIPQYLVGGRPGFGDLFVLCESSPSPRTFPNLSSLRTTLPPRPHLSLGREFWEGKESVGLVHLFSQQTMNTSSFGVVHVEENHSNLRKLVLDFRNQVNKKFIIKNLTQLRELVIVGYETHPSRLENLLTIRRTNETRKLEKIRVVDCRINQVLPILSFCHELEIRVSQVAELPNDVDLRILKVENSEIGRFGSIYGSMDKGIENLESFQSTIGMNNHIQFQLGITGDNSNINLSSSSSSEIHESDDLFYFCLPMINKLTCMRVSNHPVFIHEQTKKTLTVMDIHHCHKVLSLSDIPHLQTLKINYKIRCFYDLEEEDGDEEYQQQQPRMKKKKKRKIRGRMGLWRNYTKEEEKYFRQHKKKQGTGYFVDGKWKTYYDEEKMKRRYWAKIMRCEDDISTMFKVELNNLPNLRVCDFVLIKGGGESSNNNNLTWSDLDDGWIEFKAMNLKKIRYLCLPRISSFQFDFFDPIIQQQQRRRQHQYQQNNNLKVLKFIDAEVEGELDLSSKKFPRLRTCVVRKSFFKNLIIDDAQKKIDKDYWSTFGRNNSF